MNFLEIKSYAIEEMDCGVIQIICQKYILKDFYNGSNFFNSSNGITLCSDIHAEWKKSVNIFYCNGGFDKHSQTQQPRILISSICDFNKILSAIYEYNTKMNEIESKKECHNSQGKIINYYSLHKESWLEIAYHQTPYTPTIKNKIVKKICEREKINIPRDSCFLCEFTLNILSLKCNNCLLQNCIEDGLFTKWYFAVTDSNFAKASQLAWKIANIVDSKN